MWTPPQDDLRRLKAAPPAGREPWWCETRRPTDKRIRERFDKIADARGRPFFFHFVDAFLEGEDGRPLSGHPAGCIGPRPRDGATFTRRRGPCRKVNFCVFCWERQCLSAALLASTTHADQEVVVKFSVSLPAVRHDVETVREARTAVWNFLKAAGATRRTLWIHAFGENPAQGPKGHIDGIVSGPRSADWSIFDHDGAAFAKVLREYHETPVARWEVHVASRFIEGNQQRRVNELHLAGMYAGRPTFPTRRIWAGLHFDGQWRVRLTNVNRKRAPIEPLCINGEPQPDWDQTTLFAALNIAQEWTLGMGRVSSSDRAPLRSDTLDAILADASWRRKHRLPSDARLREWFLA